MVRLPAALLLCALTFLGSALLTVHLAGGCIPAGIRLPWGVVQACADVPEPQAADAEPEPASAPARARARSAAQVAIPEARVRPSVVGPPPAPAPAVVGLRTAVVVAGAENGSPTEAEQPDAEVAPVSAMVGGRSAAPGLATTTVPVPRDPDALQRLLGDLDLRDLPAEVHGTTVVLGLVIDARGRVGEVEVVSGSGSDRVDEAARGAVRRIRFTPAVQRGRPAPTRILFPIVLGRDARSAAVSHGGVSQPR